MNLYPPSLSWRAWRVVRRNFLVWRKLLGGSVITHLADPIIYFFGIGLGVGSLIGDVNGVSYLEFMAGGMLGYTVMNSASFEGLYSAFTRMHVQKTWESILNAPMELDDIVVGEWLWAGIKGLIAGAAMLLVVSVIGLASYPQTILIVPCLTLAAAAFASMALAFNAIARSYEFFSVYFTLIIAPMFILSGAFFPVETMPMPLQIVSMLLPLSHFIDLARPLLLGEMPPSVLVPLSVLLAYTVIGLWIAVVLTRRRLVD